MAKKRKAFKKPQPKMAPPAPDAQAAAGADAGAMQAAAAGGDAGAGPAPMDDQARMRGRYGS